MSNPNDDQKESKMHAGGADDQQAPEAVVVMLQKQASRAIAHGAAKMRHEMRDVITAGREATERALRESQEAVMSALAAMQQQVSDGDDSSVTLDTMAATTEAVTTADSSTIAAMEAAQRSAEAAMAAAARAVEDGEPT